MVGRFIGKHSVAVGLHAPMSNRRRSAHNAGRNFAKVDNILKVGY
ncbi:hypothetical protein FHT09_002130 [Xanthomonas arboricola]|nr:hypothetical protein [Xanthomonas sp. CFBP 8152]